ncbi:tetratricopeptide repeat protein [Streptomyces cyaneofuscatus]|uniref:tetratricopeptide repeat protein n=1 Tax=Streptomyces cyaneofuscatus TaxID=66883 RepID=UPI0037B7A78C
MSTSDSHAASGEYELEQDLLREFGYLSGSARSGIIARGVARRRLRRPLGLPPDPGRLVGRRETLTQLSTLLTPDAADRTVVLYGPGGVGKSALAGHFAATARGRFDEVVWLDASSGFDIQCGLAALGATLRPASDGVLGDPELATWTATHLAGRPRRLLVLDDVADPRDVRALMDTFGGPTLVTTRNQAGWHGRAHSISVDMFGRAEAEDLLVRRCGRQAQHGAAELCERLGFLPLALEIAAAYLRQTSCTARDYVALIDGVRPGARGWPSGLTPHEIVIAQACDVSLRRQGADALPGMLLETLAWFASELVPTALFLDGPHTPDGPKSDRLASPPGMARAIAVLEAHGLVRVRRHTDGQTMISVHHMVQDAVRVLAAADPRRPGGIGREFATVALDQGLPKDARDRSTWPTYRALLPHIGMLAARTHQDEDPSAFISLFSRTGHFLMDQEQHAAAIPYLERAAAGCLTELGPRHPNTLLSTSALASAYLHSGDRVLALRMLGSIVEDSIDVLGIHHSATITAMHGLATGYMGAADHSNAITMLELTVEASSQARGADHPDTLVIRMTLARAHQDSGDPQSAVAVLEHVLEDSIAALGGEDRQTIAAAHAIAAAYVAAGEPAKAAALCEEFFHACAVMFGMDDPETLGFGTGLGESYRALGIADWNVALLEKTREICEEAFGEEDPYTLQVADKLARVRGASPPLRSEAAEPGAAEDLDPHTNVLSLERVVDGLRQEFGPDHQRTLLARLELAMKHREAGHLRAAVSAGEQILGICDSSLGSDSEITLAAVNGLAAALLVADDLARATDLYNRALGDSLRLFGDADPRTCTAVHNIADCYRRAGELANAIEILDHVRTVRIRALGPDHHDVLTSTEALAAAYLADSQADRALPLFRQAYADRVRLSGPENPQTLIAAVDLLHALVESDNPREARQLGTHVLDVCERVLRRDSPAIQRLRTDLGRVGPVGE